eukprot:2410871-Amphidinium_carterae.1
MSTAAAFDNWSACNKSCARWEVKSAGSRWLCVGEMKKARMRLSGAGQLRLQLLVLLIYQRKRCSCPLNLPAELQPLL